MTGISLGIGHFEREARKSREILGGCKPCDMIAFKLNSALLTRGDNKLTFSESIAASEMTQINFQRFTRLASKMWQCQPVQVVFEVRVTISIGIGFGVRRIFGR